MKVSELIAELSALPGDTQTDVAIDVSTGEHDIERRAMGDILEVMVHLGNSPDRPPADARIFATGYVDDV